MNREFEIQRRWHWIGSISAAHLIMLRDAGLVDDEAAGILLKAVDACRQGRVPAAGSLIELIARFDERVDAITPAGYAGAATVGRGIVDVAAAVVRATVRADLLTLAGNAQAFRGALVEMASNHVVTLMPAHIDGQVAQPTSFGHWLGGTIGPLERAFDRLQAAHTITNASPLGSASLASSAMPIERERMAALLGFDGLIVNTMDAVSAADHFAGAADAVYALSIPITLLLTELHAWTRMEPESFLLSDDWTALIDQLPRGRFPTGLSALIARGRRIETDAQELRFMAAALSYGPIAGALDQMYEALSELFHDCGAFMTAATSLLSNGTVVNRALLANRAGEALITSSDLADFLMIEERIDPGSARNIAALTAWHPTHPTGAARYPQHPTLHVESVGSRAVSCS